MEKIDSLMFFFLKVLVLYLNNILWLKFELVKPVDLFIYFLIWDRFSLLFLKHVNNELNYQKQRIKFYVCFIQWPCQLQYLYRFYISVTYFYKTKIVFVRGPSFDKTKRIFFSNFDHKGDPYKKYHKICCS